MIKGRGFKRKPLIFLPGFSETRRGFLAVLHVFWGENLKTEVVSLKPGAEGPRVSMNTSTVFQVFIPKTREYRQNLRRV